MKRIILFAISILIPVFINAQTVTRFMGIPIDGSKLGMIQKLKKKGFTYNKYIDCLTGEFNGRDVYLFVVTNNKKVYRIMLVDQYESSEKDIKIRYNTLASQFEKNSKYIDFRGNNTKLSDEENIGHEMMVNNKKYQMVFTQMSMDELSEIEEQCRAENNYNGSNLTEEQRKVIRANCLEYTLNQVENRSVWFTITQGRGGGYNICIYYDNGFNQAHGEDL